MVFSSFPSIYLDHPNLQQFQHEQQQHHHHHQLAGSGVHSSQIQLPPHPPASAPPGIVATDVGGGGAPLFGGSSIRPGSMVDRARVAKLPLPEAGLKCPRCESSNTKFCYFNNYNLSQPRHFCKTCRRYWTRGGALRNVPVGGGSRRNKKTKSSNNSSSKSSNVSSEQKHDQMGANSTMTSSTGMQLPLMAALHNLNQYASGGGHMGFSLGVEAWRLPTAIGGYEPSSLTNNLFPFQEINGNEASSNNPMNIGDQQLIGNFGTSSSNVKSEDNPAMNLTKQFHISSDNIAQFWNSGNPWSAGFSGLNSSSTSHLL